MEKLKMKQILIIITYTVILYMLLNNFVALTGVLANLFKIILPFIYGFCFAYILNIPYTFFKDKIFSKLGKGKVSFDNWRNPLALISTYLSVVLFIILIIWFVIPQLVSSISSLVNQIPGFLKVLENRFNIIIQDLNIGYLLQTESNSNWTDFLQKGLTMFSTILQGIVAYMLGMSSSIYNWIIGLIFSIYMLSSKERLMSQLKKVMKAFLSKEVMETILDIAVRTNNIFKGFIRGSILDSLLVGVLCFLGMTILNIPNALLISVIQAVTNIIPVFGPFIGAVPSAFIILMDDPIKALIFIVFIIILQQIDGNIIQPRIVGDSIGLPGIWVLLSIVVGNGLFGFVGLIVGVPAVAVFYSILKENINNRLSKMKKVKSK
jgi:predicted PurR-regulated permease PerM